MERLFITTAEQQAWQQKIEQLGEQFAQNAAQVDATDGFPFATIDALRAIHYPRVTLPKAYGGEGFSVYDMLLTQETLGKYDASATLIMSWTLGVVGEIFENKTWSEDKLQAFAKDICNGAMVNRAASEAATGSPTRGGQPQTTATRTKDGWSITGRKTFTTGSYALDYIIVSAWVPELSRIGNFLIHKDTAGLRIEENWQVMAMKGTGSHDLVLENVCVATDDLVESNTSRRAKLNGWSLHIPSTYLGIAQAARDYAVHFAKTYQPNSLSTTISELPNVQTHIGEMDLLLTQARFMLYGTARAFDDENKRALLGNEINIAKYTVTNNAITIVDRAMRLVGAKSLQLANPLQRYYRDVRAGLHNPPMDDMTIQRLAASALQ